MLDFLRDLDATYVMVDAPRQRRRRTCCPRWSRPPAPTAYLRMHGRNAGTWNKRASSAAERFDHLYSESELAEWVEPLRELEAANGTSG